MDVTEINIVVHDGPAAAALQTELAELTGEEPLLIEQRGLDGATAAGVLLIVTTVVKNLPAIMESLRALLDRKRVGVIEVDGVRVVNPSPDDVRKILDAHYASSQRSGAGDEGSDDVVRDA